MGTVTDHNIAQAALLIAALRDELGEMVPKLARAEREAVRGYGRRAQALRRDAMLLRRDVGQAQFLIARLQHRFPGADNSEAAPRPRQTPTEMPACGGNDVRALVN